MGSGIKPLDTRDFITSDIEILERDQAWLNGVSIVGLTTTLFLAGSLFYGPEKADGIGQLIAYIGDVAKAMFSSDEIKRELGTKTLNMHIGKNVALFALIFGLAWGIPFLVINFLGSLFRTTKLYYVYVILQLSLWIIYFWKVPSLILLFFSYKQLINYLLNFLAGGFVSGIFIYGIVILVASIRHTFRSDKVA